MKAKEQNSEFSISAGSGEKDESKSARVRDELTPSQGPVNDRGGVIWKPPSKLSPYKIPYMPDPSSIYFQRRVQSISGKLDREWNHFANPIFSRIYRRSPAYYTSSYYYLQRKLSKRPAPSRGNEPERSSNNNPRFSNDSSARVGQSVTNQSADLRTSCNLPEDEANNGFEAVEALPHRNSRTSTPGYEYYDEVSQTNTRFPDVPVHRFVHQILNS